MNRSQFVTPSQKRRITVIDYGMGNLRSVTKAIEHLGGKVRISSAPKEIEGAEKIVLPGVGAFGDAARELKLLKLFSPLQEYIRAKKPFLGICLGLQLLFPKSAESPDAVGLGIFEGSVNGFHSPKIKVPHMGWNSIRIKHPHPLLKGVPDESFFYFVHTFYAVPKDRDIVAASCRYGKETFAAILGTGSVFATQFHPEKSQAAGLRILKNFLAW